MEELVQVERAEANYKTGMVEVVLNTTIDNRILKKTIENEDYKVLTIK